ncbi:MAG: hypothetical protein HUU15_13560, partial [Candidatus Brocadiae bacterium]|nr:hypothetical protein [Candidatus Brocadiia bacterium]
APLAAWTGYGLVRAFLADGRAPAHGPRWVIGLASVVALASWPASSVRESEAYTAVRDRFLYGTPAGEALATFYYRHTPLSAFAVRPLELNPRNTVLFAGGVPRGFPVKQWRMLETVTTGPDDFLAKARGRGYAFVVYNESAGPWVVEAAREFKKTHPGRASGMVAVSSGGLEAVFPEADPEQFLTPAFLADGGNKDRVARVSQAIRAAWDRADRRKSLRQVSRTAISMSIFLGPVLLAGTALLFLASLVTRLRAAGLKRAAGMSAVAAMILTAILGHRLLSGEGALQTRVREVRAGFEKIRAAAARDGSKWNDLRKAALADLPDLQVAAGHPEVGVRVLAMDALGAAGQEESFLILADSVKRDPSLLVRYRAADAMARCASQDKRVWYLSECIFDEAYVAEGALDAMLNHRP